MKLLFSQKIIRRVLSLALTLCLAFSLSPFASLALADSPSEPQPAPAEPAVSSEPQPAPAEPAVSSEPQPAPAEPSVSSEPQPAPAEPSVSSEPQPAPAEPSVSSEPQPAPAEPSVSSEPQPAPAEPSVSSEPQPAPAEPPAPSEPQPAPAEDVTTGDAAQITTPDAVNVLSLTVDDDNASTSELNAIIDAALDQYPGRDWYDFTEVQLSGTASRLDLSALINRYTDPTRPGPALNLAGLSDLKALVRTDAPSAANSAFDLPGLPGLPGCPGGPGTVTIPDGTETIGNNAFYNCQNLTGITIPASVTTIGTEAFYGCSNLTTVTFTPGSQLETIQGSAFQKSGLTAVTLPTSVKTLDYSVFSQCANLETVDLSQTGVTVIPNSFCYICPKLTAVALPISVESIQQYAFYEGDMANPNLPPLTVNLSDCKSLISIGLQSFRGSGLTSFELPGSAALTSIGEYAFQSCDKLTMLNLTGCTKLTDIGERAFSACGLTAVNLSGCTGLTSIEKYGAFSSNYSLTDLNLSGCTNLTTMNRNTFYNCKTLATINISSTDLGSEGVYNLIQRLDPLGNSLPPQVINISNCPNLTSIKDGTFNDCKNLKTVDLSGCKNLAHFEEAKFDSIATLTTVNFSGCEQLTKIPDGAFWGCTALATVDLSGTKVAAIEDNAFQNCPYLSSLTVPPTLNSVGEFAFSHCSSLHKLTPEPNRATEYALANVGRKAFVSCSNLTWINLGEGLETIRPMAFAGCSSLGSIAIPDSVTDIENAAFWECPDLQTVTFGGNSQLKTIHSEAFEACSSLRSIAIPDSVTTIGNLAFWECSSLKSIAIPSSVTAIGGSAFRNSGLESIAIPDSVTSMGDADYPDNPDDPTDQGGVFSQCHQLETVTVGTGLNNIGKYTFKECPNLTTVNFTNTSGNPSQLEAIGEQAFLGCFSPSSNAYSGEAPPKEITLPDSVIKISSGAFWNCKDLQKINLPDSLTTIESQAFQGCTSLKGITFPTAFDQGTSVTPTLAIGSKAFQGCANLSDIIFPVNLKEIGENAFDGCPKVHNVYFQAPTVPTLSPNGTTFKDVFNVDNNNTGENASLLYFPTNGIGYQSPEFMGDTPVERTIPYERQAAVGKLTGLKPGKNGNPPTYSVWETPHFSLDTGFTPTDSDKSALKANAANTWGLWIIPSASAARTTPTTSDGVMVQSGPFNQNGSIFSASIYPPHPTGVFMLKIDSPVDINVGEEYGAVENGEATAWRHFPLFDSNFDTVIEFLPPPVPAEASYLLTVENGTGGGYYEAEDSAPIVADLQAEPPVPGAKFLRWELVSGTGTFADANSPETRFTMAVGDSTVRAVFDMSGVINPNVPPAPTPSPVTGDSGGAWPIAAGLLLAAGAALAKLSRRQRRFNR